MSIISPSDSDVAKIQTATSKVISDAIGQVALVLIPAMSDLLKDATKGITVTIGPITIEPIKIVVGETVP